MFLSLILLQLNRYCISVSERQINSSVEPTLVGLASFSDPSLPQIALPTTTVSIEPTIYVLLCTPHLK